MANADKNIKITPNRGQTGLPNIVFTGSAAGNSVITLTVLDDNTVSFGSTEGQVFSLDSNLTSGTIWSVTDVSGIPLLRASAGATIGIAEYFGSTVGIGTENPGVYKLNVRGPIAFGSTTDSLLNFIIDSTGAGSANFQVRRGNQIRLYSTGNVNYTALASNATENYTLTFPAGKASAGSSFLTSDTSGNLAFIAAPAGGTSKAIHRIQFAAGYNPTLGADNAVFMIPFSYTNGTSSLVYNLRRVDFRSETTSSSAAAGSTTRFSIEKYAYSAGAGIATFSTTSTGSTTNVMSDVLTLGGSGIAETFWTTFAGIHGTCASGDKFRLNFSAVTALHTNLSISLIMEQQ